MNKFDEPELTYLEHVNAKIKLITNDMDEILRNTSLNESDIKGRYGIFTDFFYARNDINSSKKEKLKYLQKRLSKIIDDNPDLDI